MNCDERRDLLLLYVSDALEAAEARELREHLQSGCPACAGYLAEAQALMTSLPLGLDRVAPPPHLKSRLMERIAASEAKTTTTTQNDEFAADSIPMRLFRYLVPVAVAAGLAIMATHAIMNQRIHDLQRQADMLQHQNELQTMLAVNEAQQLELLHATSASQTKVVDLLRSSDLKLVHLQPQPNQPHAIANLLWDKSQQQWAILTDGMTPAPVGQTYELWFITKAGTPVAAGTFNVDASGRGSLRVDIPVGIGSLAQAVVTNETGMVPSPTGSAQVAGSVE